MKKLSIITLTLCMTLLMLSSCGGKNKKTDGQSLKDAIENLPVELDDDVSKYLDDVADFDILEPTEAKIKVIATLPEGWQEETDENSIVIACSKAASFSFIV